ncbi:type II CAAX prenyl endopeptidase Rce1 family protein [Streptomyces goshikiensis]|uniref:CPBP family intramembrane glutamic endopeptidase n=1 Tax=Streptomyces goshikiensis TaxID=1942 RepID=UPI00371F6B1D
MSETPDRADRPAPTAEHPPPAPDTPTGPPPGDEPRADTPTGPPPGDEPRAGAPDGPRPEPGAAPQVWAAPQSGPQSYGGGGPQACPAGGGWAAGAQPRWGYEVRASGPSAAPEDSLYHQQARNGRQGVLGRLGELLLVVGFLVAGTIAVIAVGATAGYALGLDFAPGDSERFLSDPLADTVMGLAGIAIGIPAVLLAVRLGGHRFAGSVASVTGRLRWRWLGVCAAVALPVLALQTGLLMLWGWLEQGDAGLGGVEFPGWGSLLLGLVLLWLVVPFQAAAEEFVFRGWLAQYFGGFLRSPWPGIVVASLLFALAHGFGAWTGFALLFYSAMWWGWLVVRTGGLEAVIAAHTANNLVAFCLSLVLGQLADTETAADAPWQALVLELLVSPAYCLLIARLSTRYGVERRGPRRSGAFLSSGPAAQ